MNVRAVLSLVLVSILFAAGSALAAEKRVVLQISDDSPQRQTMVLNVAGNLVGHYGAGNVDIEVVAFGPGLKILLRDNEAAGRIDRLAREGGVRFTACGTTITNLTRVQDAEPTLNPHVVVEPAGVVHIMDLMEQGYVLITP
jgi:uncharacterized protein